MSSTEFRSYGERSAGKWITIYAREVTLSQSLPGCGSTQRHSIITPENGRHVGAGLIAPARL